MNKKKLKGWVLGVIAVALILIVCIVVTEPDRDGISRSLAYKAVALAQTTRAECEARDLSQSYFQLKDQNAWYVKYFDYLYSSGSLDTQTLPATAEVAQDMITYGDVDRLAQKLAPELRKSVRMNKRNEKKHFPSDQWWLFYDGLVKAQDPDGNIKKMEILLYGTPLNIQPSEKWIAYTDKGRLGFEGLGMDTYIDCQLGILVRDGEIITVTKVTDRSVIYENVWLSDNGSESFLAHIGDINRNFPINASLGEPANFLNNLADLYLKDGKLEKIVLKKERIKGKVLSVKEDVIEIEGYGQLELGENFRVYKVYGDFEQQKLSDILVGYDIQEFVVARGKLCAGLTVREFDATTIRVLLRDTGFNSIFHNSITLLSDQEIHIFFGDEEESIPAGQEVTITADDKRLKEDRMVLQIQDPQGEITVKSVERAGKRNPSYGGRLEIEKEEEGLVLINEVYLEEYLTKVVSSEMSSSFEKEALKAQAVCARTYAYRQIKSNYYSRYGAHVDDSTKFQVYNNIETDPKTEAAVKETYGKMLFYDDQAVEAFYFSTSCGHTTDGSVWGGDPAAVPYLEGVALRESRDTMNLTTNAAFTEFIKNKNFISYDSSFPMYRWEIKVTSRQLEEKITGVGYILNLTVTERGEGGIAKQVRVDGSDGSKLINSQDQIRAKLGCKNVSITKNDGKELTGWDSLPSAFIAIENDGADDQNVITFHIYGGGYGHGVGMSQNGAEAMARSGKDYKQILKFFYEGVEIREVGD